MALIIPPWNFNYSTSVLSQAGTPASPFGGIIVNTHATTAHSEGPANTVLTAVGHDIHYMAVGFASSSLNGNEWRALVDVLYDPAGGTSWTEIIPNLVCGQHPNIINTSMHITFTQHYFFPVWLPSGSSIGARLQSSATADFMRINIAVWGEPSRPDMWWCGSGVEALGIDVASSNATPVTPGAQTYGSWTDIGTSSHPYGAVQFGLNTFDNAVITAMSQVWQIGYNSTKLPGSYEMVIGLDTTERFSRSSPHSTIWCDIPSGTTLQARGATSNTTNIETAKIGIYGVY